MTWKKEGKAAAGGNEGPGSVVVCDLTMRAALSVEAEAPGEKGKDQSGVQGMVSWARGGGSPGREARPLSTIPTVLSGHICSHTMVVGAEVGVLGRPLCPQNTVFLSYLVKSERTAFLFL